MYQAVSKIEGYVLVEGRGNKRGLPEKLLWVRFTLFTNLMSMFGLQTEERKVR